MSETRRLIVIGIDGLMPELVEEFVREGAAPNLGQLVQRGAFCQVLPAPPCDTPTNWTTLATGAWTGSHGNNSFGVHHHGEQFDRLHDLGKNIFPPFAGVADDALNQHTAVQWFWQAAADAGKRCLVVNYPGGWPPNCDDVVAVDGSGPYSSKLARLTGPCLYSSDPRVEDALKLRLSRPTGWQQPPDSERPPLETGLVVTGEAAVEPTGAGWIVSRVGGDVPEIDPDLLYCCLLTASTEDGYDTLHVCKGRDADNPLAALKEGEWSDWVSDTFPTPYGDVRGFFKLKLRRLSRDGKHLDLYRTTIFNREAWAHPDGLAEELIDEFLRRGQAAESDGELEWDGTRDEQPRVGPLCQVYESIADQAKGLASLCEYLCSSREWDLLMTQIHAPDGLNHQLMNALYPESPQYDPSKVDEAWSAYREEIGALDRLVGEVVEECADEDTLVAVVSDHGAIPTHTKVWLGKWLVEAGLLAYKEDEGAGDIVVDWENTKVILGDHPLAQNVWVNLRGRESHGVVEPGREYEEVRNEVIRVLSGIVDPATGQSVVAHVMRWEDAQHLGQWGDCVGDLIYFLEPGYTNDVAIHSAGPIDPARMPQKALEPNDTSQQGVHHCYHPTARLGGFSVRGVLILAGPGVREKYARRTPLWMVDVAPTLAHFSGLPCPRDAEGAVALDLAAGSTVEGETPSAAPARRPWEKPPEPEPEAEPTDEPEEAEGEGPAEDPESAEQDDDEAETAPAEEG